ncbi:ATP-dependent helicase [Motilibacter aurantiacus]|uniref:ATP-dependent helicase n=1 Tax=Motilibacter aurantiacus TaxID=2714955 RepID=UPI001408FA82|nr:ATP-dependent DNA helicase [Motilibacter aurantiacus]NHC45666.1 ATP-dependent helicase [Motilibacter aurantiacus]
MTAAPVSRPTHRPAHRIHVPARAAGAVALDDAQARVAAHRSGPLLVLAGPGTGKTTTLVESVAALAEDPVSPLQPEQVLVLTFSRRAALELRERVTARLGGATGAPVAWTFHSFCLWALRTHRSTAALPDDDAELRLLSGPEQDVAVRELLAGIGEGVGQVQWPERLRAALGTRGLAEEVRAVVARARELGLDPPDLARAAERAGRDDWAAAAAFFNEYLYVLDAMGAVDYAELVHRAAALAEEPETQSALRRRFAAVFVDEYQDTDPAQERLLQAIAGDGRHLVAVGDPDQSIYAFRGADISGILEFPDRFARADGEPAPVVTLRRSRRAGERLLAASRSVACRLPIRSLPREQVAEHRALVPGVAEPGRVQVRTYPSAAAEADATADLLRRAHLEDGVPWSRMAVLVRSGRRSVPLVRRVLGAAGVPVAVAGDELPLAEEPAVAPLLLALTVASGLGDDEPAEPGGPRRPSPEQARTLLLSPLGGAEAGRLRALARELRAEEKAAGRPVTPSDQLLRDALLDPRRLVAAEDRLAAPVRALGSLLAKASAVLHDGGPAEEALWVLWDGTRWPRRLEQAAYDGGAAGRAADRDLDAVVALFDAAARADERPGVRGARLLLAELGAQHIPGDTLAEGSARTEAVRVLTAHRSKGLEWDLVVVLGVQEGVWPDLRRRGSLLEPDRLGRHGLTEPPGPSEVLAEERRLFYVAVTRARQRLVVSAVASADDDGERPSRFLDELGVPVEAVSRRVVRPLSAVGLVADLRRAAVDPAETPALRAAAARRLADLAAAVDDRGVPLVPAAHPSRWWGLLDVTDPGRPLLEEGAAIRMSGSSLSGLTACPLRWFLQHEAAADAPTTAAIGFGRVVHVLADEVARGGLPAEQAALDARIDAVWDSLAFEARWQSAQQRAAASDAVRRFLAWHAATAARGRRLLATEHEFRVEVPTPDGTVVLRGTADRVELDADGLVHVVDFKTGKTPPSSGEVAVHPQLGAYQLATEAGAFDGLLPEGAPADGPRTGGAELVQLRVEDSGMPKVQRQAAPERDEHGRTWVEDLLAGAVARVVGEDFAPTPSDACARCPYRRACPAQPEGRGVVE